MRKQGEKGFIPERLIDIRTKLGLSAAETARRTGLTSTMIYKYETGIVEPTGSTLRVLALYLGTSTAYLCGDTDNPEPEEVIVNVCGDMDFAAFLHDYGDLTNRQRKLINEIVREFSGT